MPLEVGLPFIHMYFSHMGCGRYKEDGFANRVRFRYR